jgi:hypothetical protein
LSEKFIIIKLRTIVTGFCSMFLSAAIPEEVDETLGVLKFAADAVDTIEVRRSITTTKVTNLNLIQDAPP